MFNCVEAVVVLTLRIYNNSHAFHSSWLHDYAKTSTCFVPGHKPKTLKVYSVYLSRKPTAGHRVEASSVAGCVFFMRVRGVQYYLKHGTGPGVQDDAFSRLNVPIVFSNFSLTGQCFKLIQTQR